MQKYLQSFLYHFSVSFQSYNDREEVLRRSKLIRGLDGGAGRGIKVMGCQSEPQLYITEDSSRRVREQRSELIKFSREVHRRFVFVSSNSNTLTVSDPSQDSRNLL